MSALDRSSREVLNVGKLTARTALGEVSAESITVRVARRRYETVVTSGLLCIVPSRARSFVDSAPAYRESILLGWHVSLVEFGYGGPIRGLRQTLPLYRFVRLVIA